MAQGAIDGIINAAVFDLWKELGNDKSNRRLLNMLPKRPPAIIINLLKILIRAFKKRDILRHPKPAFRIGNGIDDVFTVRLVESIHIMLKMLRI